MASPSSLPTTMAGVAIDKNGGLEVLNYRTDLPLPQLKDNEVLVQNEYIGVNFIDTYFRTGLYKASSFPYILGEEGVGTVVASKVATLPTGTRVVYSCSNGSYAAYTATLAANAYPIPAHIDSKTACAVVLQGITALTLVTESYEVKRGDWILVHAAAGGVGQLLLQLIKQKGAHSIATASSDTKRQLCLSLGAEHAVPYDEVESVVERVTGGKGVAAVLDGVGKATFDTDLKVVARKGTVVSFGNASGAVEPFSIIRLMDKNLKLVRPKMAAYLVEKEEHDFYGAELWKALDNGMKATVHEVYPLKDVAKAHQDLEGRKTAGKLLMKP